MGRIKQLDTQTANMIAAGEVVERPMGVVKELVENAIDAGSTRIQISIEEGGLKKITVSDNGCGMDAQDAEMCFGRHATSKIHNQKDLWSIHTLGFRGEALPSISSVAKVTVSTSDGNEATRIVVEYGKKVSASAYPCSQGTEIVVEGLFYQTPARLKHMKSGSYEASLIQDVISRFALSHPEIAFQLVNEGRDAFRTSGQGNLLEVVFAVYGKSAAENAIEVNFSDYDYSVHGYIVKPIVTRATRNMMHIFLNGRMVKTYKLYKSVEDAYGEYIPKGRYPMAILSIEMDPHLLDVNVHPSKWEVRISKEVQLELLIKEEIHKALANTNEVVIPKEEPKVEYYQPLSFNTDELVVPKVTTLPKEEPMVQDEPFHMTNETRRAILDEAKADNEMLQQLQTKIEKPVVERKEEKPFPLLEVIGQYKDTHILATCAQGLAIIDQRSAQSRILYEQTKKNMRNNPIMMDLLVPITLHVSDDMIQRLDSMNQQLEPYHIHFESFGGDTILVRRLPSYLQNVNQETFLEDIVDTFQAETTLSVESLLQERIVQAAASNSIHVHQKLTMDEMREILKALPNCENAWTDFAGKPLLVIVDEKDLLKRFHK